MPKRGRHSPQGQAPDPSLKRVTGPVATVLPLGTAMHPRTVSRVRRLSARLLVLAPAAAVLALDFALRGRLLREFTRDAALAYARCFGPAAVAWGALVVAAARRRGWTAWAGRGLAALAALFAVGTQLQTVARYGTYLNWRTALMGNSLLPFLGQQLWGDRLGALGLLLAPVVVLLTLAVAMRRLAAPGRRGAIAALPVGVLGLAAAVVWGKADEGWDNGTSPDVLWLAAVGALAKSHRTHEDIMVELRYLPDARSPEAVPALHPRPERPRNVLLLVDESVRGEDICSVPGDDCPKSPFTNALLPDRLGFTQMRAIDSTTALSMVTMLSGRSPADARASLLSAPLLPEYAHAAGADAAYWTSQNLLYANAGRFLDGLPLSDFVCGTQLAPYADYLDGADDGVLLDRVLAGLAKLREPYLAVAQLANTHFPYAVDPHDLPFSSRFDWRAMDDFGRTRIRYWDALHRQDRLLARFVAELRARPGAERTIVVFLSDHGEQIGEHGQTGHTWNLHDEEIRVPMWIDAPPGTLAPGEIEHLRAARDAPLTELEIAPTLLDLLGVWDDPALAPLRARMLGASLLRGLPSPERVAVMTNCSSLFSCAVKNWGAIRGSRKLFAAEEDTAWHCYDAATDPRETDDLGAQGCQDLRAAAEGEGRGTPFGP
jgi:glucan phosphoethanolaminetransferase (alkaline phosphatase superfamily)